MGVRTGEAFIQRLNESRRDIRLEGEYITENTADHPRLQGLVRSYARLFDMQHHPDHRDVLTYPSPSTGDPVATGHLAPRTPAELAQRSRAFQVWAEASGGMLGRTGDYLNSALMAMAAASGFFAEAGDPFAENIRRYAEHVREQDLLLTHTLIHPQANRSKGASEQVDPHLAAAVLKETDAGIVLRGARMLATLGPIADELLVFPSTVLQARPEDAPYAYACAVPCDAPGLTFICRESFDYRRPTFDHPLGSRYDELDAVVVFADVFVPWERVFIFNRPDLCNRLYAETNAVVHMAHQVVAKNTVKVAFLLGVVLEVIETIQISQFQHVQEKACEVMLTLETLRAFLRAAEADAAVDRWGIHCPAFAPLNTARNWFPRVYPRLAEIIQQLGASGLMALPTQADMDGDAGPMVEKYLQARGADARERVRLFRLAWDLSASAFAGRQILYERFFFGDPVRMAGAFYQWYDKDRYREWVRTFLEEGDSHGETGGPV